MSNDLFGHKIPGQTNSLPGKIEEARLFLQEMFEKHKPVAVFAGLSGGHDSLVCCHLTMNVFPDAKIFHINTGVGIRKTRKYVRDTCNQFGWDLWERHAKEGEYENFVLEHGFPGPSMHNRMYQRLKERVVYAVCKEAKQGHHRNARVMFVTGIRAEESKKRAGYNRKESKVRAQVWVNPIYDFTSSDKDAYIKKHGLPRNEVVDMLGMSGECLCGAFAHKGEKDLVRIVCPDTADYLDNLERRVNEKGFPWGWEHPGPPDAWKREKVGQMTLFQPMCVGCQKVYDEQDYRKAA